MLGSCDETVGLHHITMINTSHRLHLAHHLHTWDGRNYMTNGFVHNLLHINLALGFTDVARVDQCSRNPVPRTWKYGRSWLGGKKKAKWKNAILGHETVMDRLHVVLHFVWARELLGTDRAREHLPLVTLMVEEGMPLEAVLVLEGLLHICLGALGALVHALGDRCVAEQVEASHTHLGQLFGRVLAGGGGAPPDPSLHRGTSGRRSGGAKGVCTPLGIFATTPSTHARAPVGGDVREQQVVMLRSIDAKHKALNWHAVFSSHYGKSVLNTGSVASAMYEPVVQNNAQASGECGLLFLQVRTGVCVATWGFTCREAVSSQDQEQMCSELSAGMKGRAKREIPEKTRRPAASSGTIPTVELPGIKATDDDDVSTTRLNNTMMRQKTIVCFLRQACRDVSGADICSHLQAD
ncbi:hypothetical protein PR048_027268 [Dryococelus australis]|uniref:Uncharacterized protein n=1 Tax=Dryococelus australis TaxID=614101 RepID=A0ABQ9GEZ5_9NEOP|nr:hypothetical protein PR048_027268 [Dryococelus australis]